MALTNYVELQAAVADWLERGDLAARIPDFIRLAEAQMNRVLRVGKMLSRAESTIATDGDYGTVPSDYLQAVTMTLFDGVTEDTLEPTPPQVISRLAEDTGLGRPRFFSVVGSEFEFYPDPDRDYQVALTYYAKLPALSVNNATNWLLNDYPDAYLFGALKEAGPFLQDNDRTSTFEAKYQAAINDIRAAEKTPVGRLRVDAGLQRRAAFDITRG